jgi:DNA-binding transcriptional LysR family regulator
MLANISSIVEFLPEDLENFLQRHAAIKVDLVELPSRQIVEDIESQRADLGICVGDTDTRQLSRSPYRQDHLVVVLPPGHALAGQSALAFHQTLDFDYVGLHSASAIFARTVMEARQVDRTLKLKIHVPSFDALCRMVGADLGIGLMPDRAFELIGKPLGLQAVPLTDDWAARELVLVYRDDRTLSAAARLMLDNLSSVARRAKAIPLRSPNENAP